MNLASQVSPETNGLDSSKEPYVLDSEARAAILIDVGNDLFNSNNLDGAIAEYREAIQIQPDNIEAHRNIGNALFHKKDFEEAITEYREALRCSRMIR